MRFICRTPVSQRNYFKQCLCRSVRHFLLGSPNHIDVIGSRLLTRLPAPQFPVPTPIQLKRIAGKMMEPIYAVLLAAL
jgi:hypothetical protein